MKKCPWSQQFGNDQKLKYIVNVWFISQAVEFYDEGIKNLFTDMTSALMYQKII